MFSKLLTIAPIAVVLLGQSFTALAQNSLYLAKYNSGGPFVEVHAVSGSSGYQTWTVHAVSAESATDVLSGKWTVENGNVYFIKTVAPTIEVHRLSKSSNYAQWDIHSGSGFPQSDGDDGTWTIDGGDLYFIKTKNTAGMVEVHRGNHNNGFQLDYDHASGFTLEDVYGFNSTVTVRSGDLYVIKTSCTESNQIEVWIATRASDYQSITRYITVFPLSDGPNGFWEINNAGDLYYVKTQQTGNNIGVHLATKASGYQPFAGHWGTVFGIGDAPTGTWIIDPAA